MSLHMEISFEDEICWYLEANGWRYLQGDARSRRALKMVSNIQFCRYQISFKLVKG